MAFAFTGSNYYKHSFTEYEVEAYNRDVADAHIFTAAAKIERSAALDAEITGLDAEIAATKTKRNNMLAAMDTEIAALESRNRRIQNQTH